MRAEVKDLPDGKLLSLFKEMDLQLLPNVDHEDKAGLQTRLDYIRAAYDVSDT